MAGGKKVTSKKASSTTSKFLRESRKSKSSKSTAGSALSHKEKVWKTKKI